MSEGLRIGLDLDGVCYDYASALKKHMVESMGYSEEQLPAPQSWDFAEKEWSLSYEELMQCIDSALNARCLLRRGEPTSGLIEVLEDFIFMGHEVHIVTARSYGPPGLAQTLTREWLSEWGVLYSSLTFSSDKTVVPVDIFLEDNVDNYLALDAVGHFPVLFDQPWNRHAKNARRVSGMHQFADMVLDRAMFLQEEVWEPL